MAKTGRGSDQFQLRLPTGLKEQIKVIAEDNGRSINSEIVSRLEYSVSAHPYAALIQSLMNFNKELMDGNAEEITLLPAVQSEIRRLAKERGVSAQVFASRLAIGAIEQLTEQTELGQRLSEYVMAAIQRDAELDAEEEE